MDSLEYAIRGLYRSGIGENSGLSADEVEELLDGIDFRDTLATAVTVISSSSHSSTLRVVRTASAVLWSKSSYSSVARWPNSSAPR